MFEWPAPFVKTSTFLANDSFRFINNATITVIVIATFNGIEVKLPVIIPTPKNNATNNNKGNNAQALLFLCTSILFTCFPIKNTSFSQTMKKEVFMCFTCLSSNHYGYWNWHIRDVAEAS
ncbi:Putative uncharacterized protein [Staphylococcus aureus subsp. aureus ST228]|uniref:Uncharacterized protein n=1 Tax=Staphylococcus aureus subsp. aureus ST228 TaxID=1074919 RepID=A0A7U7IGN6_STAAU|nr:Putative uncharacterized protein [Staphylococcus aureus subsp. aureus ST228]CCJ13594.1 Putative uncharacterized protein [Staphylococcus aureus subsp. aureus ST228]CCJ15558.1 Putative uncharacterized protein [Staphylococcus aureus subsp. aureus ST228]CCJ19486.1 Putative uncharacterized protein [Staphylococcus aureus subsp. aureus ST228]CCJ21450.1 Putative uncharacterized protein [Staphylococcus aureus subsp. aureus ST228]